jgi:thymidylate synthase
MITFTDLWHRLLGRLLRDGTWVSSRNGGAFEIVGAYGSFDMRYPLLGRGFRKLFYRFAAAESHWILSGSNQLSTIAEVNKHLARFSDDGEVLAGAYGPRWLEQRDGVVNALAKSTDTRQAVVSFWIKNPPASKDIPCSLSLQLLVRDGKLHAVYTMRSSDLWLGLPYDAFAFTMMALWVLLELRTRGISLELGTMFYQAGSMHLYEANADAVRAAWAAGHLMTYEESFPRLDPSDFESANHLLLTLDLLTKKVRQATWLGEALYGC